MGAEAFTAEAAANRYVISPARKAEQFFIEQPPASVYFVEGSDKGQSECQIYFEMTWRYSSDKQLFRVNAKLRR